LVSDLHTGTVVRHSPMSPEDAADEVIGSNDDDGVAAYLEQWF
jgi:hydroxymethylpyrimidine pyrophosphatase-like HAD family hydrolase